MIFQDALHEFNALRWREDAYRAAVVRDMMPRATSISPLLTAIAGIHHYQLAT